MRNLFKTRKKLLQKIQDLVYDRNWWKRQAVTREEHSEYWQGVAKYYKDKWHEALGHLPEDMREKLSE